MNRKKRGEIEDYFLIGIFVIAVIIIIAVFYFLKPGEESVCGDGMSYDKCSSVKPYFCEKGLLIEKASVCGCYENSRINGELCISDYQDGQKNITLKYVLDGQEHYMNFSVYQKMAEYISNLPKDIFGDGENSPSRTDFKLRNINEEKQRQLLLPLVVKIQNSAKSKEDQMRIAVSLVQNIHFGESEKKVNFFGQEVNYSRYPYEVLYDMNGVCGEKSELLAFLLKEIGYSTAIFYFHDENHEAVGIKCPVEKSYKESGYCFVETSGPAIINDGGLEYVGGVRLMSFPEIMIISEGDSLNKNLYEYDDAEKMNKIRERGVNVLNVNAFDYLKRKYGLTGEYNV